MRTRGPKTGTAALALLCAVTALNSGCTTVNETLVQDLGEIWLVVFFLLTLLIVGVFRGLAWQGALEAWEHPAAPKPGTMWWQTTWAPLLLVVAIFGWFAAYDFSWNPLPSSPEQQWSNAGAACLGSLMGTLAGWFGGKEWARRRFRRRYPGQS